MLSVLIIVGRRGSYLRLSVQMKKILLVLLKAETDPKSLPVTPFRTYDKRWFEIRAMNLTGEITDEEMEKMLSEIHPRLTKVDIIQCIKPSAVTVKTIPETNKTFTYVKGSVELSVSRSLKRLIELGLVDVVKKVSPGHHGYLYGLTDNGRATATAIRNKIKKFIQEFQSLV
jgi:hypothetical protein